MSYRTIVVGTDGSATAAQAVDTAIEMATADRSRLVIVTAFERHDAVPDDRIPADVRWQVNDANDADQHARGAAERANAAGLTDVVVQALDGDPSDKLIESATDFNADLVVVGSIGLTGAARLLGSVANNVLHHAPCDVLVVHTHD